MSASFAYDSPVEAMREMRSPSRLAAGLILIAFVVIAALIVNDSLSATRAVLIGIAGFSAAWAASIFGNTQAPGVHRNGATLVGGALATLVALSCAIASTTDGAPRQTLVGSLGVGIAVLIWVLAVMTAERSAGFDASPGTLALLTAGSGLLLLPVPFADEIASDASGLLLATIAPLTAALLVGRQTRRSLVPAVLLALIASIMIYRPDDATIWLIAASVAVLLLVGDTHVPERANRASLSFTMLDGMLVSLVSAFLATYLAFSMAEPVRGFLLGALAGLAAAVALVQRAVIAQRDQRMMELAATAEAIRQRARLDPLTALPNRSALDARLLEEVERAVRYRQPLSVCFIDIDHFKAINDTAGHPVGDQVLRSVAHVIRATIRSPDFVGRYGGEEFVVIAPGTWTADAATLGARIQSAIAKDVPRPLDRPVTVSIGIAGVPEHGREPAGVLKVADLALYAAKFAGRNRVEIGFVDAPLLAP